MKAYLRVSLLLASPFLLVACASTQGTAYGEKPAVNENVVQDAVYVATVENIAKQRGTRVVWVNPPYKRVPVNATASAPD
jgi:2-iminoacetate synthase ThiH